LSRPLLVVIADSPFQTAATERVILRRVGAHVKKFSCSSESDVIAAARNADIVLCDSSPITRNVISSLQSVRGIVEYGIGFDNIDVNSATEKGIVVCNVPDFMTTEVADHAVALALVLARKLHKILPSTQAGEWNYQKFRPIDSLDGKTAGIIGFGNIGRQVAKRFHAFQMHVKAYDPYVPSECLSRLGAEPATLEDLLSSCDVIAISVPLTKETRHMIGKRELANMRKSSILVNTSRGWS
jgi:D-3-phosphoglycerate dehydrogenase